MVVTLLEADPTSSARMTGVLFDFFMAEIIPNFV
jgi:hypothetical protein